jgi:hypothetical protein
MLYDDKALPVFPYRLDGVEIGIDIPGRIKTFGRIPLILDGFNHSRS